MSSNHRNAAKIVRLQTKKKKDISNIEYNSLMDSCRSGNVEEVKNILTHYELSDYSEWDEGYALLCEALKFQRTEVAMLLLQNEIKVNTKGPKYATPLHYAIQMRNMEIIKLLLQKSADINDKNYNGRTVLHLAVLQQDARFVEFLLEEGADIESTDKRGYTPLLLAVECGNVQIVQCLLNHKADIHACCRTITALHFAVENNNLDIVNLLLHKGALDNMEHSSYFCLLNSAVSQRNHIILQVLLERIGNLNCSKIDDLKNLGVSAQVNTLLHRSIFSGQKEVVQLLLNNKINVNSRNEIGRTALYYAYNTNQLEMCKHLLANGASINVDKNRNILHMSVQNEDEKFVKFLLEEGIDVNGKTNCGHTSLHIAVRKTESMVKLLLKYNSNVNLEDNEGFIPLHVAAEWNDEIIVNLLLRAGSSVNHPAKSNVTPLHFAARYGQKSVVQSLIEFGADLKAKDSNFETALCYAVKARNTDVIKILLGKNPDLQDEGNKLALCLAIVKDGLEEIVELFLLRGFTIHTEDFKKFSIPEILLDEYSTEYTKSKYQTIFKDLLKCEPSVNGFFEYKVLRNSVRKGFCKIVQSLLKPDAKIDVLLENGLNLLHIAVSCERTTSAKEFLSDPYNGDLGVVVTKLLLDAGADVNCKDSVNNTPLHNALYSHNLVLELLLEYDADIHIKNIYNYSPLYVAFFSGWREVVVTLLDHGAVLESSVEDITLDSDILDIVQNHIIKSEAIKKPDIIKDYGKNYVFVSKCHEEINKMIKHQIWKSVSVFDLLAEKDFKVELFLRNKKVLECLDSIDLKKVYPVYFSWLEIRIKRAKRRNSLLVSATNSLEYMFQMRLPQIVIQEICSFMSYSDLRKIIFMVKQ